MTISSYSGGAREYVLTTQRNGIYPGDSWPVAHANTRSAIQHHGLVRLLADLWNSHSDVNIYALADGHGHCNRHPDADTHSTSSHLDPDSFADGYHDHDVYRNRNSYGYGDSHIDANANVDHGSDIHRNTIGDGHHSREPHAFGNTDIHCDRRPVAHDNFDGNQHGDCDANSNFRSRYWPHRWQSDRAGSN